MASHTQPPSGRPPRDELVRAVGDGLELRDGDTGEAPTMVGYFARFNEWTEIDSVFEGNFMERVAPGAFKKTLAENHDRIRVLFQHGQDPQLGDKPLGKPSILEERRKGPYYEVPLLNAPYVRDIEPGLRAGLYGASFRFSVQREEFNRDARPSEHNPAGLPERTLKELSVKEFGPVTFPAYAGATAGVRSLTDEFMLGRVREVLAAGEERMDVEDLGTLARMIELATDYIAEQDEPEDQANIPVMQDVLKTLAGLVPYEIAEDEGAEPEDEGMASDGRSAPPDDDAAQQRAPRSGTPREPKQAWPKAPPDVWEEDLWTP